jgi:hypothetical protein
MAPVSGLSWPQVSLNRKSGRSGLEQAGCAKDKRNLPANKPKNRLRTAIDR